jgi:SAM-dependent methyltransferase
MASKYLTKEDVLLDVGGGAGRYSLPLAFLCREVINVDSSPTMLSAFVANAKRAGIGNIRSIEADWLEVNSPTCDVALVAHTTYLTRLIVPFLEKLHQSARKRVLILVNDPPPPSWNRVLYEYLFGEKEEIVPGQRELIEVVQEMGIKPQVFTLESMGVTQPPPLPNRDAAIQFALARFLGDQWALWPLGETLERKLREVLETRFDELFHQDSKGFVPQWIVPGNEILITWVP